MKRLSFFSLYHHRKMVLLFIWSWLQCLQGGQIILLYKPIRLKVFRTVCPFTAPSKHNQTGSSKVTKTFTDFCPLSVSNARKMFSNWFQTLIILWKAALGQRLNSLKARVKYVVIIKNNRTTRALPTYQSFVVKARNTRWLCASLKQRSKKTADGPGAAPSAFFPL